MRGLDHSLLHEARKFVTAANVHRVKTLIFCYEISKPGSSHQKSYEKLLREFVSARRQNLQSVAENTLGLRVSLARKRSPA
jgi:hypothetical protein